MKSRFVHALGRVAPGLLLLAGCSGQPAPDNPSLDTLASAIRAAGYVCANVVNSSEVDGGSNNWRVSCEGTLTYSAKVTAESSICVTPVPYIDSIGPALTAGSAERCVSASDI